MILLKLSKGKATDSCIDCHDDVDDLGDDKEDADTTNLGADNHSKEQKGNINESFQFNPN